ncbi:ABC-F family ATP-binding cassette domain-containing protein [Ferrimicrobium sp.]|uniref:ABC-F family ATP-binding cassette domain-containing protein n=1 Tax=Ferrimicrobium sp. TaxID=2926050 RepID=UPI0026362B37|nr:ABC-F family ATP-binding cassette domain-containing protein [Ferrimicrobium sp.]
MTILVDAAAITVTRSDRVLFGDLSVTVSDGDRLGVVGINGTGKSTLLRVLGGEQNPEVGEVRRGKGVRISLLDQEDNLPDLTVREIVGSGWENEAILDRLDMIAAIDRRISELSGGQRKRVALARVLSQPGDLLILDEPTNHLDLAAVTWLEAWLARFAGGVILVSHDRYLLDRVTNRMLELDRGKAYLHNGGYAAYLAAGAARDAQAEAADTVRRNLARHELAWLRRGAKARTRKPQARIDAARQLIETRPQQAARPSAIDLSFGTPRLGTKVIEVTRVTYQFPQEISPIFTDVTISLDPRERLGIVGANGAGKTTLLELLASLRQPTQGTIEIGTTVHIGYYAQHGPDLDPSARVRDVVAGPHRLPGDPSDVRLMERFWFTGELPWATVGTLSGGERRRLQLLTILAARPNVLLLDEPTNDLDLDTLRALEEYLEDWPGALVTVSHDRTFLDRVTDRILACARGGISEVPGGVATWIAETSMRHSATSPSSGQAQEPTQRSRVASSPKRSPSTLRFQLQKLESLIESLTQQRDQLTLTFQEQTDHEVLAKLGTELARCQAELDSAEDQWLTLTSEYDDD